MRSGDQAELDDVAGVSRDVIERSIRSIGDRTFYLRGDAWIESTVEARSDERPWTTIGLYSDEHFALLRAHPEAGPFLALGKVVFRLGERTYEVK
jgi:hypothetical protein